MASVYASLKKFLSWHNLNLTSLLCYYRYLSLFITSALYFIGPPDSSIYLKLGVSLSLLLEAYIFIKVYSERGENSLLYKKLLIIVETIGIALVLIFTGGLNSPFVWYALNPILLSATLLPIYFCWVMTAAFIAMAMLLQRFHFYAMGVSIVMWPTRASLVVTFILITLAAQIYSFLIRSLYRQSEVMEKQMEHIKSIYESIEVFSHQNDPQEIVNLFASYGKELAGAKKVIVWIKIKSGLKNPRQTSFYAVRGPRRVLAEDNWYPYLKQILSTIDDGQDVTRRKFSSQDADESSGMLLTVKVRSKTSTFGILSAFYQNSEQVDEAEKILIFLADLCAVALEKKSLETIAEDFLLVEEKDRIASEIHDRVTQNLFGVVYSLEMLIKKEAFSDSIRSQLRLLQEISQKSLKELRTAIYSMSSLKNKEEPFVEEVQKYLYDLGRLNSVSVNFECRGELILSSNQRSALYRIIREATGNAIRHGCCCNIQVSLQVESKKLSLIVADDGSGFEPSDIATCGRQGLGLVNMKELARSLGGHLAIEAAPGTGVKVFCSIPLGRNYTQDSTKKEMIK